MSPASDLLGSSSDAFKFPKLTGMNYQSWSGHMKSALQSKYLWLIVTGDEDCPPDASTTATDAEKRVIRKEKLEWKLRDQAAMGNMKGACENSQLPFIEKDTVTSAKEMWEELKKVHQTSLSKINVHYLFEELYTKKYTDDASMDEHIASLLDLGHRITNAGEKLDDLHLARAMVLSLPKTSSWELIKIPLFELATLTSDLVSTRLLQEANRRQREKAGTETALFVKRNFNRSKGKGKAQPTDECHYCHKKGHWANVCRKREADEKRDGGGSAHMAVSQLQDLSKREVGRLYAMGMGSVKMMDVLLDCAATSHMFFDRNTFVRYTPSTSKETISLGDGKEIPVAGWGSILLSVNYLVVSETSF
jgi:gag-polypeptide of LTR copia-type